MYIQPGFLPLAFEGKKKTEKNKQPEAPKTPIPEAVDTKLKAIAQKYNKPLAQLQEQYRYWAAKTKPDGTRRWDDNFIVGLIDNTHDPNAPRATTQSTHETGIRPR